MKKPMSKMLLAVGIFFAVVFGWYGVKKAIFYWYVSHYQPPAVTVSAIDASNKTWQSYLTAIGTLSAVNGVDLAAEVPGIIQEIHADSGQSVQQGDVILIMKRDLELANLKSSQAKLKLAEYNYQREKTLFNKHVSSQSALDTRYAQLLEAEADIERVNAQIKQKTITAPFAGKLGIRQVNLGQYVSPGVSMISLQAFNPLYVSFTLPEQYLGELYINQTIDVTVNLGEGKTVQGIITAINAKVDPITRNVLAQARIANDDNKLYPGMYGQIKIWKKAKDQIIVIPQTAIAYSLSGEYVFLVKTETTKKQAAVFRAHRQYVKVGERRGDEVAIVDGLKEGDKVITSGQLKLQNGTPVIVDNTVTL